MLVGTQDPNSLTLTLTIKLVTTSNREKKIKEQYHKDKET